VSKTINALVTIKFKQAILDRFQAVSSDINLRVHPAEKERDIPNRAWQNTDVLFTDFFLPALTLNTKIKWVHSYFAGVDNLLQHPYLQANPEIVLTNSSGIHAAKIGEWVVGMMLTMGHHVPKLIAHQAKAEWPEDRYSNLLPQQLNASTVGILGYGQIGREIARLCKTFGATVLATKRNLRQPIDENGYTLPGKGDPEGELADRLYPPEATAFMIKECDYVVITLPLTPTTRDFFDEKLFAAMQKHAVLINIGRGGIVKEDVLLDVLNTEQIGGAVFDVFAQEPLPADSPLWKAKNMIISPHVSGNMPDYQDKAAAIFEENLRRYVDGETLLNVVDRELGY
jgi:phosphoglycerate dehydrogenase-like enzyme